jgi:microsomal dipeptidase-like Zn-dependent dipeptidase
MKTNAGIFAFLIGLLVIGLACSPQPKNIHEEAITIDSHVDIDDDYATKELDPGIDNPWLRCDLTKMERGGMDGVFLVVYVGNEEVFTAEDYPEAYEKAIKRFKAIHRLTEEMYPDRCELATSPEDVTRIARSGKRAIMIGIENGFPLGEDLALLKEYYNLGARYITLCHSRHNQICDSSRPEEPLHNGISEFGKKVVAEMNRLGIMCDVSHISEKSFWDLIEISKAPIIASHSGCSALNPHNRNLTDDQLRAVAKNGGVIQIVALGSFLKDETPEHKKAMNELREELGLPGRREMWRMTRKELLPLRPTLDEFERRRAELEKIYPATDLMDFVNHIDHAVKVAGIDHVGIGTDFDGGGGIPGFYNHGEAKNVTDELLKRGYSDEEIKKIWGENLLRTWNEVERVAAELGHN